MFQLDDDFDVDVNFLDDVLNSDDSVISEPKRPLSSCNNESSQVGKRPRLEPPNPIITFSPSKVKRNSVNATLDTSSFFDFDASFNDELQSSCPSIFQRKKVAVRKFPGPAGLLPQRQANTSLVASNDFLSQLEQEACPDQEELPQVEGVSSQGSGCVVDAESWSRMEAVLGSEGKQLLSTINLAAVKERAKLYRGRALRVPFLALSLASIDTSTPDPSVKLQDASGEISGALHREAWEVLVDSLVSGSVLILSGVGVVPASLTNFYINITRKNVVAIFSPSNYGKVTKLNDIGSYSSLLEAWHRTRVPPPSRSPPTPVLRSLQQNSPYGEHPGWSPTPPRQSRTPTNIHGNRNPNNFCPSQPRFLSPSSSCSSLPRAVHNNGRQPLSVNTSGNSSQHGRFQGTPSRGPGFMETNNMNTSQKPTMPGPKVKTLDDDPLNQSIVESLLEGIDTDSLFGDF